MANKTRVHLLRLLSSFSFRSFSLLPYCGNKRTSTTQLIFKESKIFFFNNKKFFLKKIVIEFIDLTAFLHLSVCANKLLKFL